MDLDDILGELEQDSGPSTTTHTTMGGGDDEESSSSSDSETTEEGADIGDLDDLIADISNTGLVSPRSRTGGARHGARKRTVRKQLKATLDGTDLDAILDQINHKAKERASADKDKLGWGVISTKRKFDLRAPRASEINKPVECTLIVLNANGERCRVPIKYIKVNILNYDVEFKVGDNKDGTYPITFKPTRLGTLKLVVDGYGKRQFEHEIQITGCAVAKNCTAVSEGDLIHARKCQVIITAQDANGDALSTGGTQFKIAYNGSGQISDLSMTDRLDGTYALEFVADKVGQYVLYITLDGENIKDNPLMLQMK